MFCIALCHIPDQHADRQVSEIRDRRQESIAGGTEQTYANYCRKYDKIVVVERQNRVENDLEQPFRSLVFPQFGKFTRDRPIPGVVPVVYGRAVFCVYEDEKIHRRKNRRDEAYVSAGHGTQNRLY